MAYFRPGAAEPILCHKPARHQEKECSWDSLRKADSTRLDPVYPETALEPVAGKEPIKLLHAVERGDWDPYLEDLLDVTHRRKRLLREARTRRRAM
jgi:hypothetical protein